MHTCSKPLLKPCRRFRRRGGAFLWILATVWACQDARATPESAMRIDPEDEVGDCFHLASAIPGAPDSEYVVVTDKVQDGDMSRLTVVPASGSWLPFCSLRREPRNPAPEPTRLHVVSRHDLRVSGATRYSWTYGILALPFKFHTLSRTFSSGATVGPYVGRRVLTQGTGLTWAVSVGLTQTTVNRDGYSTSASGIALAAGAIFDVNKGSSPFHTGLFLGHDYFGKVGGATPDQGRGPWLAMQVGYDFSR